METRLASSAAVLLALVAGLALPTSAGAASFDFGDAPDRKIAYETSPGSGIGVVGQFPSLKSRKGPRHESTDVRLGTDADREGDSRQINIDHADDGFRLNHVACREVAYRFTVNVRDLPRDARRGSAYLNLFVDWNADGDWEDVDTRCGPEPVPEHRIQNHRVKLRSLRGDPVKTITVKRVAGGIAALDPGVVDPTNVGVWLRASVTAGQKFPVNGGGRGRGSFRNGESEDYGPHGEGELKPEADFGDAPDRVGHPPACRIPVFGEFIPCNYASRAWRGGPRHLDIGGLLLGDRVDPESDTKQVDRDQHDDGFRFTVQSCAESTFSFFIRATNLVNSLKDKEGGKHLSGGDRAHLKLVDRLLSGSTSIYLNAWVDRNNNGTWRDPVATSACGRSGDWVVQNLRLERQPLRALLDPRGTGLVIRNVRAPTGEVTDPNGCVRASLTPKPFDRFVTPIAPGFPPWENDGTGDFESPVPKAGGAGETEDYCSQLAFGGDPGPGPQPDPIPQPPPDDGIKKKTVTMPLSCPGAGTVTNFTDIFIPASSATKRHELRMGTTVFHAADDNGPHSNETLASSPCGSAFTTVLHDGEGNDAPNLGMTLPDPNPPAGDRAFRVVLQTTRNSGSGAFTTSAEAEITYDETP